MSFFLPRKVLSLAMSPFKWSLDDEDDWEEIEAKKAEMDADTWNFLYGTRIIDFGFGGVEDKRSLL